jgi:hypothetical protein
VAAHHEDRRTLAIAQGGRRHYEKFITHGEPSPLKPLLKKGLRKSFWKMGDGRSRQLALEMPAFGNTRGALPVPLHRVENRLEMLFFPKIYRACMGEVTP